MQYIVFWGSQVQLGGLPTTSRRPWLWQLHSTVVVLDNDYFFTKYTKL